jgi:hypothetical protein
MDYLDLIIIILSLFLGFAIGRFGDKYGGHLRAPHHWIYGLILIIAGIFIHKPIGYFLISFGIGHFISDLDDFLNLRFFGVDVPHKWEFWSIK